MLEEGTASVAAAAAAGGGVTVVAAAATAAAATPRKPTRIKQNTDEAKLVLKLLKKLLYEKTMKNYHNIWLSLSSLVKIMNSYYTREKNLYYTYVEISRCKIVPISGFFFKNKNQLKLSLYTTCTGKTVQSTGTSVQVTLPS